MSQMFIPDRSGHTTVEWNAVDEATRIIAEAAFEQARLKRYTAFRSNTPSGDGEMITAFDATAPFITMIPPMVGG